MKTIRKITFQGFFVVSLIAVVNKAVCQSSVERYAKLRQQLLSADTVLIVSHENTADFFENSDGNTTPAPPLILDGKLNRSIIHESLLLKRKSLRALSNVLTIEKDTFPESSALCYNPHHSIVMVKHGTYLCIEICFQCGHIKVSDGIEFSERDIGEQKWKKLKQFFLQNHFKYELEPLKRG